MANLFDSANIAEREPALIRAGDLTQWKRTDLGDDYANSAYTLKYSARLEGTGSTEIEITASASGDDYLVSVGQSTTASYTVGGQERFFYEFCLDDVVPADHLLRRIYAVFDLDWLRGELLPYYSHTGRPSIDPELMIRMLLVGYCYGIRSERRLCQEVELNLAYRWFCRLGLEDRIPDHSTFSLNRHGRFRDSDVLRRVFEHVV